MQRLDREGFMYDVNKPFSVGTKVSGYKRVNIDIGLLDKKGNIMVALFIGPAKSRRMLKYKLLKVPLFYFHTMDIDAEFKRMVVKYAELLF